ncbi:hypothetical protein B484DRAFT_398534 [Ochromonadaceae sp. CCMP2298]|nr:hypothetical protein B484DRAFT_398534 [Ochromonadaceae sp. CCMP2298]
MESKQESSSDVVLLACGPAALPASTDQVAAERAPRTLGELVVALGASTLLLGGPGRPRTDPAETGCRGALGRQLAGGTAASHAECGERGWFTEASDAASAMDASEAVTRYRVMYAKAGAKKRKQFFDAILTVRSSIGNALVATLASEEGALVHRMIERNAEVFKEGEEIPFGSFVVQIEETLETCVGQGATSSKQSCPPKYVTGARGAGVGAGVAGGTGGAISGMSVSGTSGTGNKYMTLGVSSMKQSAGMGIMSRVPGMGNSGMGMSVNRVPGMGMGVSVQRKSFKSPTVTSAPAITTSTTSSSSFEQPGGNSGCTGGSGTGVSSSTTVGSGIGIGITGGSGSGIGGLSTQDYVWPSEASGSSTASTAITTGTTTGPFEIIDPYLRRKMRPHQLEGAAFLISR